MQITGGPPIDPELVPALTGLDLDPITPDRIATLRATRRVITDEMLGGVEVSTADADGIPVVVLKPAGEPRAGVLYAHGGGMMSGTARSGLPRLLDWVTEAQVMIVSPEYRLAPEHPYPAPFEDCYTALCWLARQNLPKLLVAGTSSGGTLAAAMALKARDDDGPRLDGQLLVFPMLDDRCACFEDAPTWSRESSLTAWNAYLGDHTEAEPYAAPARATSLAHLPPAYLDVGSADLFRDETVEYATRIWRAGGLAELHVWPGAYHAFDILALESVLSRKARAARLGWLQSALKQ